MISRKKMPKFIKLVLTETDTFFILNLPSKVIDYETPEGVAAHAENERYIQLTTQDKNRKQSDQAIQTEDLIIKNRKLQKEQCQYADKYTFASGWDIFDNYNGITNDHLDKILVDQPLNERLNKKRFGSEIEEPEDIAEMNILIKNTKFLDAVSTIERLLANNNFQEAQKKFRGMLDADPFRPDIEFNYQLQLLWTFSNDKTTGKRVTCFQWNHTNKDILAVGYGKYYFNETTNGAIMIWNIKNPVQPERSYSFENPVSSVAFSIKNPHLLAVGFENGLIQIIDISNRKLNVISQSTADTSPCYEAITEMLFDYNEDYKYEEILSSSKDGKICKTGPVGPYIMLTSQIMLVSNVEGNIKGSTDHKKYANPNLKVAKHQSALLICKHPIDKNIYYIGTAEGSIHKYSKYSYHREISSFKAHDGSVNQMKFSTFCNKIFLTCGDDWYIRLWIEDVDSPILELKEQLTSVQGADWCPSHSTIIASICEKDIVIWDIQRRIFSYQSCVNSTENCINTVVEFTDDGRCLIVGDIGGNVHVYFLQNMPFSPFFQANSLISSLKRALITSSDHIKNILDADKLTFIENQQN